MGLYGVNDTIRMATNKLAFHVGEGTYGGVLSGHLVGLTNREVLMILIV